jgi:hypothetical protein
MSIAHQCTDGAKSRVERAGQPARVRTTGEGVQREEGDGGHD